MPTSQVMLKWLDGRVTRPNLDNELLLRPRLQHPDDSGNLHDFAAQDDEEDGCVVFVEIDKTT
jgi:hypothetical protein